MVKLANRPIFAGMSEERDDREIKLDPMEWEHVNPAHKPTKKDQNTRTPSDDPKKGSASGKK